jgi:hypothetical protein
MQQNQQSQSQLSLSLPNSLIQSTNNLLISSQIMATTNSNGSTATLASTTTQNATNNNNILSTSLILNELNARFDMWTECLAELLVYKNILKCPLTRIEAWRMVFYRLTQLFPYVDPKYNKKNKKEILFLNFFEYIFIVVKQQKFVRHSFFEVMIY